MVLPAEPHRAAARDLLGGGVRRLRPAGRGTALATTVLASLTLVRLTVSLQWPENQARPSAAGSGAVAQDEALEEAQGPAALIAKGADDFYDASLEVEARYRAVPLACEHAKTWLRTYQRPATGDDIEAGRAVARLLGVATLYAGPWFDVASVNETQGLWFEALDEERDLRGVLGNEYFVPELYHRATFLGRHVGLEAGLAELTDERFAKLGPSDGLWVPNLHTARADMYRVQGRFREAFEDLETARSSPALQQDAAKQVSEVAFKLEVDLGRIDRAKTHLNELRRIASSGNGDPLLLATCDVLDVSLLLAVERNGVARKRCQDLLNTRSEELNKSAPGKSLVAKIELLAAIAGIRESRDEAELRDAIGTIERLQADGTTLSSSSQLQALLAHVEALLDLNAADEAAAKLMELEDVAATSELNPATSKLFGARIAVRRSRLSRLRGDARAIEYAREELDSAVRELIGAWSETPLLPGGIGFLQFVGRRSALAEFIELTVQDADQGPQRALECLLLADACSTVTQRLGGAGVSVGELFEFCALENACVVYVLPSQSRIHRLVIDGAGVRYRALSGLDEVELRLADTRRALRTRPGGSAPWPPSVVGEHLEWFAERLVPDDVREGRATYDQIVYIGLEMLGVVPVEVLPLANGEPLGLSLPVTHGPSASALIELSRRSAPSGARETSGPTAALFALGQFEHGLEPIDLLQGELRALTLAGGTPFRLTSGAGATGQAFLDLLLKGHELFVAWTHGAYDPRDPQPAGLYVAARGGGARPLAAGARAMPQGLDVLSCRQIEEALSEVDRRLLPRAVFLASCSTARRPRRSGDDASSHLGGAFLGAGVKATLVSPVPLDRDAAMAFLTSFSEHFLRRGATAAEAAFHARRALATDEAFAHPHFWSGIQIVGWGGAVAARR